jgi:isoleucyl-tRNA synthetase
MYRQVPPQVDLPALEHDVLAFWRDHRIFDRAIGQTADHPLWVFYEGPPTANGMPGTHHVEARVFKDAFPRYRTMRGYHVPRKAGWDCHGLPVELAVERELGFSGKQDIEAFGVAEFNARCRASVLRHVDAFEDMTERMGFWVDISQAYRTMDAEYVDSVWWSLKVVFDRGLLVEDYRITPYCPRCGTGLSDHELGQEGGYETVVDPSVYVRFPLTSGPFAGDTALLVWTTTPWTLVSNTAVAVHPDVTYLVATDGTENLVVAEPLVESVLGAGWAEVARFSGREMQGWTYRPPLDLVRIPDAHIVVLGEYVTIADGTGLVHQAPAFGEDDMRVSREYSLPVVNPIRPDGTFEPETPLVGGQFFKKADEALVADLDARGLLFRHLEYEHSYPHCWRCHTPLLYYALPSWYIKTTAVKGALLAENEKTNWFPETIKWGRYGDWLRNNVDWALSRDRYWGTPLPIWRCPQGHLTCVGSRSELSELTGTDLSGLDPHRPYIDEITFACPHCKVEGMQAPGDSTATRVSEVIDAWYDSGAMPFAQWGYPYVEGSKERFERAYPAQFIAEAIDQTRGWFYTLMVIGTIVFGESPYQNVLCLGLILAEDGRKMSKHLGNILEPIPLMEQHGADALRWFMLASGSPWAARRIGHTVLQEIVRKFLLTYWNTVSFQTLYARAAEWTPSAGTPPVSDRPLLDRWVLAELQTLVRDVDAALNRFDSHRAGRLLAGFVDDLSNWYVRRSRRRFWDGDPAALATLHECLVTGTQLLAPMTPFITERVWQDVVRPVTPGAPESVHLASWPVADAALVDTTLSERMALVRRVVELGRAARAAARVRTRQPLGRALVGAAGFAELPAELQAHIADELNVAEVAGLGEAAASVAELMDYSAKANFRALGKRFGAHTKTVAAAIATGDAAKLAAALRERGSATVAVDGETITLSPDEVVVTETPRAGWAVESAGGETVALDLTVTPALRRAGLAREVVRILQEARKSAGLEITDRVSVWWTATSAETAEALMEHGGLVADEVLATTFAKGTPLSDDPAAHAPEQEHANLGFTFRLTRAAPGPSHDGDNVS